MNSEIRTCRNCKNNFTIEPDDFNFYEKMGVPAPTFCPDCRLQRRLLFRNNRVFYRRSCDLCKQPLLTIYNDKQPFTIYCRDCWLSDKWDPMEYGREYDFSRPFFEQFRTLQEKAPRINLYRDNFIASDYCNYGLDFKDCYLLFGGHANERVYFGNQVFDSQDTLDVAFSEKIEFGYEIFECARTNKLFFGSFSTDCLESSYLVECRNCISCFGCVGLVNKQYYIFNEPHTKEEYEEFITSRDSSSYVAHLDIVKKLEDLELSIPHRYARIYKSANSDGDDLYEVKNVHHSFSSRQAENSKYLFFIRNNARECYDNSFQGFNSEFLYEIAHGFSGSNTAFGVRNMYNQNSRYNEECQNCLSVFGCEGLRKKNYCILNKQYSKEEYEALVPKIIEHMKSTGEYGEFFPAPLSPFAYNESIAQEYFPLTKERAIEKGYLWKDIENRNYQITLQYENIPDSIKEVKDEILDQMIACKHKGTCLEQCTEAFKITPNELAFYRKMSLPLPRLCPNCRHYARLKLRNPMKLWHRQCMNASCANEFETTYSPERQEIVYCEQCYQQTMM